MFRKTIRHAIATMLYADPTVPEREIVELLGHEGKLARTTRIYAKYVHPIGERHEGPDGRLADHQQAGPRLFC